ncbi:MAG: outer membrane protein assembly factor BamE [Elusimicrobia bacterium]|nr:outer membrane protein assembly factor BamE [Elusimicrobiota bacterium]MDE2511576.1 outer membrane protein assembly factor BamE [Elusimicrobiota bacterium]
MKRVEIQALGLAAAAALAGCVSIGKPFPADRVSSIVIGKTTQTEILAVYGQPFRTGIDDGNPAWTYADYRLRLFGDQKTSDLYVRFNADGTVKSYSFNTN